MLNSECSCLHQSSPVLQLISRFSFSSQGYSRITYFWPNPVTSRSIRVFLPLTLRVTTIFSAIVPILFYVPSMLYTLSGLSKGVVFSSINLAKMVSIKFPPASELTRAIAPTFSFVLGHFSITGKLRLLFQMFAKQLELIERVEETKVRCSSLSKNPCPLLHQGILPVLLDCC